MQNDDESPWITSSEAAAMLGVTRNTLRRWCRAGDGPTHYITPGGEMRFKVADVQAWLESTRRPAG